MSLPFRPFALSLTIALVGASATAFAAPGPLGPQDPPSRVQRKVPPAPPARPPQRAERPRHEDPLSDSIRRVERRTRGQVISAERVPYDGRSVSRVKVVDDEGRVRIYMDDPQDGASESRTRGDDD